MPSCKMAAGSGHVGGCPSWRGGGATQQRVQTWRRKRMRGSGGRGGGVPRPRLAARSPAPVSRGRAVGGRGAGPSLPPWRGRAGTGAGPSRRAPPERCPRPPGCPPPPSACRARSPSPRRSAASWQVGPAGREGRREGGRASRGAGGGGRDGPGQPGLARGDRPLVPQPRRSALQRALGALAPSPWVRGFPLRAAPPHPPTPPVPLPPLLPPADAELPFPSPRLLGAPEMRKESGLAPAAGLAVGPRGRREVLEGSGKGAGVGRLCRATPGAGRPLG